MNDYEQYNPILQICEKEDQLKFYDPELAYKIKNTDFYNWSCSICLDNMANEMDICFPKIDFWIPKGRSSHGGWVASLVPWPQRPCLYG